MGEMADAGTPDAWRAVPLEAERIDAADVIELQLLAAATLSDFNLVSVDRVADTHLVATVTCSLPGLSTSPGKRFTLKLAPRGGALNVVLREGILLAALPPHPHVARVLGQRTETVPAHVFADGYAPTADDLPPVLAGALPHLSPGLRNAFRTAAAASGSASVPVSALLLEQAAAAAAPGGGIKVGGGGGGAGSATSLQALMLSTGAAASVADFGLAFPLALHLARALAHCAARGVTHRDVSPSAVVLRPAAPTTSGSPTSGSAAGASAMPASPAAASALTVPVLLGGAPFHAVLCEFGHAARCSDPETMTFPLAPAASGSGGRLHIGGALPYLPPEVITAAAAAAAAAPGAGASASAGGGSGGGTGSPVPVPYSKSDVWGLGVLLYQLGAGGAHPFPGYPAAYASVAAGGDSAGGGGGGIGSLPLPALIPSAMAPSWPAHFRDLVCWALRPSPAERPTPAALAARLQALLLHATGASDNLSTGLLRPTPSRQWPWSTSTTVAGIAPGSRWVSLLVKSWSGATASVPLLLPTDPAAAPSGATGIGPTVGDVIAAAAEMLPLPPGAPIGVLSSPASHLALLHGGRRLDPGAPAALFPAIMASAAAAAAAAAAGTSGSSVAAAANGAASPLLLVPLTDRTRDQLPIALTVPGCGALAAAGPPAAAAAAPALGRGPVAPVPGIIAPSTARGADVPGVVAVTPVPAVATTPAALAAQSGTARPGVTAAVPTPVPGIAAAVPGAAAAGVPGAATAALTAAAAAAAGSGAVPGATGTIVPVKAGRAMLCAFSERPGDRAPGITLADNCTVATTRDRWSTIFLANPPTGISERALPGGRYAFSVQLLQVDPGAGCIVGVVDVSGSALVATAAAAASAPAGSVLADAAAAAVAPFDVTRDALGAHAATWAYSKTGKASGRAGAATASAAAAGGADGKAGGAGGTGAGATTGGAGSGGSAGGAGTSTTLASASVGSWIDYGEPFAAGDVITCEVDTKAASIRFWRNDIPQGTAFIDPALHTAVLRPAICIGCASGGKTVKVAVIPPAIREFDRARTHHRIIFSEDAMTVSNAGKWASSLLAHPGLSHGKLQWSIRLDETRHGAGVAVGVVDPTKFDWEKQNLGASTSSWCYSKTGKRGDGKAFVEYGRTYSAGDVVSCTLDMDECTLSFAVNGEDQGIAYRAADGIGSCPLVPAVCLGSTDGGKSARVSVLLPTITPIRRFDRLACNPKIRVTDAGRRCETSDKWGTIFLEHPGITASCGGKVAFAVHVSSAGTGCGAGIGFADQALFKPHARNLGAAENSWCYSKTGKKSDGAGWSTYGSPFKTGDVITAELDLDDNSLRFYLNGRDQGVAFRDCFADRVLVPAAVLGSSDGGHYTQLEVATPAVIRLDPRRANKLIEFTNGNKTASTDGRWSSALADNLGVRQGSVLRFAVKLEGDGGAAVGFVDSCTFKPALQNLGASPGTWALSKTGKISCGDSEGFKAYTDKLNAGDVIGCEADLIEGIVRFWKNGVSLGHAFTGMSDRNLNLVPAICIGSNSGGKLSLVTIVEFKPEWAPTATD